MPKWDAANSLASVKGFGTGYINPIDAKDGMGRDVPQGIDLNFDMARFADPPIVEAFEVRLI